ncbi:MAG TPA: hypothetical protein VKR55_25975 [Bradyrhizobium sp.]|uniref:hypothetical protein n=1 Tax=Bradyrhizobium sp. TaxID=376 RepID=UPI002BD06262|nr:hypothetical protein [Bradyrhizobium sp.]HLZ05585.1 hypothetical protein [Bradyrhizobium sp.]
MQKRRRFRQTTTLAQRLTLEARRLRERARNLPPGAEQTQLWRKVRQAETALRIDEWLASPRPSPAGTRTTAMDRDKKRSPSKPSAEAAGDH